MSAQINWQITQLDCYPQDAGKTDVVFNVHWVCSGTQDTFTGAVYSTCGVQLDPAAPYTPYADLTESQVLGWIWTSGVDKDATEAAVQAQIDAQINPTVVAPPLPWSN